MTRGGAERVAALGEKIFENLTSVGAFLDHFPRHYANILHQKLLSKKGVVNNFYFLTLHWYQSKGIGNKQNQRENQKSENYPLFSGQLETRASTARL